MARRKNKKREFNQNPYLSGLGFLIVFIVVIYLVSEDMDMFMGAVPFLAVMLGFFLFVVLITRVWVSTSATTTVYHANAECGRGKQKTMFRIIAKAKGLQPCAKCHSIQGMGRKNR
ncbi:MAG: hypothetical protein FWG63_00470 [Defluviitaleaceae bacterium]|nr:hypothetical protein [Defluviitaleaceae bacterium]